MIAIIFLAARLAYVRSSQVDRFKLTGASWWLHLLQAAAAAVCLLINLFLLNGRLATSRASLIPSARLRGMSPYEWVGATRPAPSREGPVVLCGNIMHDCHRQKRHDCTLVRPGFSTNRHS